MSLDTADMLHIFAEECEDLLHASEEALLKLEDQPDDTESVGELFRAFHTIKGSAGIFGLDLLVSFTHQVESVLGKVREGELAMSSDLVTLFLNSRDHLEKLSEFALQGNTELDDALQAVENQLRQELAVYLDEDAGATEVATNNQPEHVSSANADGVDNQNWHISLRFASDALRNGMDPSPFVGYLENLGEVTNVAVLDDTIPDWTDFDAETCYLGFEIGLNADTNKEAIEEVFEFVQDDCEVRILPPHSHLDAYVELINGLPEKPMRIGDILRAVGALTERELDQALGTQDRLADDLTGDGESEQVPPLGEVVVQQQVVQQPVVDAAVKKQEKTESVRASAQQTVRVNAAKLEALIDLVGELVIGGANADLMARQIGSEGLIEAMENMSRLVEDIRDTTLGLRMVQIGDTFNRFKRVVREVSKELDKNIDLQISGTETELDKTVVEKIGDPLMHLIRNAMDHGIESAEQREVSGKPLNGTVSLDAFHDSGSIVIQIKDDGGGLNKDKILAKAMEKDLVKANQNLTDHEIYRLIFAPGFSTAAEVTNLSGRGVGMDVVKRNIDALRGQVDVDSTLGVGTTFTIRLPLTLAIIDGFQVAVGDAHYIIPLDMVEECVELDSEHHTELRESDYLNLRGSILPFVRLSERFGSTREQSERENIVVVNYGGMRTGFVVDALLGEHQTVIKPLGKVFQHLQGVSGATILGNGEVALIIDVPGLVQLVTDKSNDGVPRKPAAKVQGSGSAIVKH